MARLVFPRHMAAFTGRVQSVLFLAEKQGFTIQHIRLDVGDSPYFVLTGGCSVVIGSDVCSPENASEPLDYYIQYLAGQPVHQANCTVKVGQPDPFDGDVQMDQWLTEANTPQQITYPFVHTSLDCQHNQHLAWVLALLAMDFTL
ncbi:MAG: thiamine phosphate synthase, partial [Vibrio sp.]